MEVGPAGTGIQEKLRCPAHSKQGDRRRPGSGHGINNIVLLTPYIPIQYMAVLDNN